MMRILGMIQVEIKDIRSATDKGQIPQECEGQRTYPRQGLPVTTM